MKKILSSIVCLLISTQLLGCFDYTEINKVTFATSIIFDIDEDDNTVVYLDCVRPYRTEKETSEKGKRLIFEGTGETALDAIRSINIKSDNNLNFSQVRAYIFTEKVAKEGIDKYMNFINNKQQLGLKPYMFVYYGKIDKLVDIKNDEEEYLGLYLEQLENINKKNAKCISANVNDYITENYTQNELSTLGVLRLEQGVEQKKFNLVGGVVMRDNKFLQRLEEEDTVMLNLLTKSISNGTFQITNPKESSSLITLDILKSDVKTDLSLKDGKIILSKKIDLKISIGEIQGKLNINSYTVNAIKKMAEENINTKVISFFNDYKDKDIDMLGVKNLLKQKDLNFNGGDVLKNTNLDLDVNVKIDGSSLVRDSL